MNVQSPDTTAADAAPSFSPVDNDPPLRWQRKLGIVPPNGTGVGRRVIVLTVLAWLVPTVWAAFTHRLWEGAKGESLLQHFGVHARFLVAVVLLIVAESLVHKGMTRMIEQFTRSGIIGPAARAPFERILSSMRRLRDNSLPWILLVGIVLAWTLGDVPDPHADELSWALGGNGQLGFGGWWVAWVSRPIFLALLLAWLWRLLLVIVLFARIGRLELSLVPTHPDRVGGLGFVQAVPGAFAAVTFALSVVVSSHWAHGLLYHGQAVESLKLPGIMFVAIVALTLLLPLLMLAPALLAAKKQALPVYAALVGEHGRLVHRRWILHEEVGDAALLDAPEIGPIADTAAIYEAAEAMRPFPIGKRAIMSILVPIALPMLIVVALQVPIKDVLVKLLKALV